MPAENHIADRHAVGDPDDALARTVALLHAQVRNAARQVDEDPAAAAASLHALARASGAVVDALGTPEHPQVLGDDAPMGSELLSALRASDGSVRFAFHGREQPLSEHDQVILRTLLREVLASAEEEGSLSASFTWSPEHLDVLVVHTAPLPATACSLQGLPGAGSLPCSEALVLAAGGDLRIEAPQAGGVVVAATLPLAGPAESGGES